jgi:hypothetical protein
MSDVELRFKIGAYTPKTIPMERLGLYMADLGAMLGQPTEVHFVRLEAGSTNIVHHVKEEALPKVVERVDKVRRGEAEIVHLDAFRSLNKRLKEDNGTGKLVIKGQRAPLLVFPGRDTPPPTLSEPVIQAGTLDGQLISIGGRDASVPARLQDGDTIYRLTTNRSVARQLAPHLYGNPVRVIGEGKWLRSDDGVWTLDIFKVLSMDALDDRPLSEVVDALRRIPNDYTADAWDELLRERDDGANAI